MHSLHVPAKLLEAGAGGWVGIMGTEIQQIPGKSCRQDCGQAPHCLHTHPWGFPHGDIIHYVFSSSQMIWVPLILSVSTLNSVRLRQWRLEIQQCIYKYIDLYAHLSVFMSLWYYFSAMENLSCLCLSGFSCSVCDSQTVPSFSIPAVSSLLPAAARTRCGW